MSSEYLPETHGAGVGLAVGVAVGLAVGAAVGDGVINVHSCSSCGESQPAEHQYPDAHAHVHPAPFLLQTPPG